MLANLKEALISVLEKQQFQEPYCIIKWLDTRKIGIVAQKSVFLPSSIDVEDNASYLIDINGEKRLGKILVHGTKEHCESILQEFTSHEPKRQDEENTSETLDDVSLMSILAKILTKVESIDINDDGDVHNVKCVVCEMEPIRQSDRYRCLECTSPTYDICGRCFEKHRHTGKHLIGHAMVHFKLPNEILGIQFNDINNEVNLNNLRNLDTLRYEKHDGIKCDGICHQQTLIGLRFKCDTCPNYNLCEICAIDKHICTKNHKKDHPLILTSNKVIPKIDPDDILLEESLGRGGFGRVYKALWRSKNLPVACKIIETSNKSSESDHLRRSFLQEIAAYRELSGPCILRTFAYAIRDIPAQRNHGQKTQFMILMELMGRGSLQDVLDKEPHQLSLRRKLTMSRQIASAMRRIHQHGMIHRDIRPDNILITDNYIAKIGDMGIARVLDPNCQHTQVGFKKFMPPEFFRDGLNGFAKFDEKLDIYTYGLTLNQLFTEKLHNFRSCALLPHITIIEKSPILYDEIILRCINEDSKKRPTAIEIERILKFYEAAFSKTMDSNIYKKMDLKQKNKVFIKFYENNRGKMQCLINEKISQHIIREIPVEIINKKQQPPSDEPLNEKCRVN
ncbi:unnamed protein product [Rotaria sordida]|uniref:Uncharacterized protein n=2 Tax=Rotaria sordida TaxID=392033 RepID=A0A819N0V0_9BILA|nr:unnamed protein product [Rotaria sordida]